nr:MAG TPA: hypothetical protein [Caudoviricetes sp.]
MILQSFLLSFVSPTSVCGYNNWYYSTRRLI